jgi:hypothetical protein
LRNDTALRLGWIMLTGLTVGLIATGGINTLGVFYWQGFPVPWFFQLGLIITWLRFRRELDFELRQNQQPET